MIHNHTDYHDIHDKFINTRKPPRSKKYAENQRPLRRVSEAHLMLQRDPHSYVIKINGVEVARYFDPEPNGDYQIALRGLYGTYDINLMYQFTQMYSRKHFITDTGAEVEVPLNPFYKEQGKDFSAVLTFTSSHQLIVEKSWHADVFKLVSTSDDKAKRKSIKDQLDAFITLQMFKLPTLKDNAKVDADQGAPFSEDRLSYGDQNDLLSALRLDTVPVHDPAFLQLFDRVSQSAFDTLASKRIYSVNNRLLYAVSSYWGNRNPEEKAKAEVEVREIINAITPEEHKKSLVSKLMKYAGKREGTQAVALPQFANKLPNKLILKHSSVKGGA